jgi:hypothetical protein
MEAKDKTLEAEYLAKEKKYFSLSRTDLIKLVPDNPNNKVLEVGASGGYTLVSLKNLNKAAECVGVELFPLPYSQQDNTAIDRFIIADTENDQLDLPEDILMS